MPLATFDPSADPWGVGLIACAVLVGFALLWATVALLMRQSSRGARTMMSWGLFGYLGTAVGATLVRVLTPEPPPPPDLGPPVVIGATVPTDPDAPAKTSTPPNARTKPPTEPPAKTAAPRPTTPAEPQQPTEPAEPPPAAPTPPTTPAEPPPAEAAAPPAESKTPPAPTEATPEAPTPTVSLGAPTLTGREALRFVDEVAHDDDKCSDPTQVAAAARELPGALDGMPRARVDKAAVRLEACRRKLVAARAWSIRKRGVEDRTALAEALAKRLKAEGTPVLITLRGAAKERIRIGGATLDAATATRLLDGGLRDELVALGFAEIVLANMQGAVKETPDVPSDQDRAIEQLAEFGLGAKIEIAD